MSNITQELLHAYLHYDPETGIFIRLKAWNRPSRIGKKAGYPHKDGYWSITVLKKSYLAHRLAWLYMTGSFPEFELDHLNGIRDDNAFANLREATHSQNLQNTRKARSDSKSGVLGVTWYAPTKKWRATIILNGKQIHIGYFATTELAHAAYLAKKRELHPFGTI